MSRRRLHLPISQLSFLNVPACTSLFESACFDCGRPLKRRRISQDQNDGWASILVFHVNCPFQECVPPRPAQQNSDTHTDVSVEAKFTFNDPLLSVFGLHNTTPLFTFVCRESEGLEIETIAWLEALAQKHISMTPCMRLPAVVSFRRSKGEIVGAELTMSLDVRFDLHLAHCEKFSFKDRIKVLNHALQFIRDEVSADRFYTHIGRLSKDFLGDQEKKLQHPDLACQLFPFQSRAVAWMLNREGEDIVGLLNVRLPDAENNGVRDDPLPPLWTAVEDLTNQTIYVNPYQGYISTNAEWVKKTFAPSAMRGGILAEVSRLPATNY
jgi:hypothetical protein